MASSGKEIKFLAVARKSDKSILATHTSTADRTSDFAGSVAKVLNSPGWSSVTTNKLCLDDPPNAFYVTIDEAGRVYIAITSKGYPSRYIYGSPDGSTRGVLSELKRQIVERFGDVSLSCPANGLNSKASGILKSLATEFNDLSSIDKLANVQAKVEGVKSVMASNINAALKNTDKLEDIDDKAVVLADSASRFKSNTGALKRNMQWRYIKMVILMTLLVGAVLTVIIVPIVISNKK